MPERIQLRRTPGWRKPEGTVVCARPSKWGNPFKVGSKVCSKASGVYREEPIETAADAVERFRDMLEIDGRNYPPTEEIIRELRGKDLACWCLPDEPCHVDVLLEVANEERE